MGGLVGVKDGDRSEDRSFVLAEIGQSELLPASGPARCPNK